VTRENGERNETLWGQMDVTSSVIRKIENIALKWYGRIE
jgi:hypothetical protein